PDHPGGRPFNARHPAPALRRVIKPRAIMITGPRPRFIALPVPTAVCPNPVSLAVWTPPGIDGGRAKAPSIAADINPGAVRAQRPVKVRRRIDLNGRGNFKFRFSRVDEEKQTAPKHEVGDDQDPECFHMPPSLFGRCPSRKLLRHLA